MPLNNVMMFVLEKYFVSEEKLVKINGKACPGKSRSRKVGGIPPAFSQPSVILLTATITHVAVM